jgi:hypothetical protein
MLATASTRRPSMWNSSSQYRAFATRKLRTCESPKLNTRGAPVGLLTAPRIAVLVEGLPVEVRERPLVLGEVGWHPVHEYPDAGLVQAVDEVAQVVGMPEAARRGVVPRDLVPPTTARTDARRAA